MDLSAHIYPKNSTYEVLVVSSYYSHLMVCACIKWSRALQTHSSNRKVRHLQECGLEDGRVGYRACKNLLTVVQQGGSHRCHSSIQWHSASCYGRRGMWHSFHGRISPICAETRTASLSTLVRACRGMTGAPQTGFLQGFLAASWPIANTSVHSFCR